MNGELGIHMELLLTLGISLLALSASLFMYYRSHAKKIVCKNPDGSGYYKSLSWVFAPYIFHGVIWTVSAVCALLGHWEIINPHFFYLTDFMALVSVIALVCFWRATERV